MTITLDLPDALARQLLDMPEPERNRYVTAMLDDYEDEDDLPPLSEEDLASLRRSRADLDAGRVRPLFDVLNEVRKEHGLPPLSSLSPLSPLSSHPVGDAA